MNERIRELAEQAGFYYTDKTGFITPAGCDPAKFAELIVRECSQFVEDKFDFCGDEIIIAEQILKHFGVEE
jgi:hypothetical protein